jgi:hypothetical protein
MLADLGALLDKPLVLLIVMAVGGVIGILLENTLNKIDRERARAYWRGRNGAKGKGKAPPPRTAKPGGTGYAAEQLRLVMQAAFERRPLLNQKERRLLACLDKALADEAPGWRAMGQVSLGEILSSKDEAAYFAVNSKRVDLLVVDAQCQPLFAIEYQGTGHHQGKTAIARDAVKMEALRKAGIGYETIRPGDTPAELRALVRKVAGKKAE